MPVLDLLGIIKVGGRALLWVLLSPISVIAFVGIMCSEAFQKIEQLFDRLYLNFLSDLVSAPIEFLQVLTDDQQNTLFGWVSYAFAFDKIFPFLYHVPIVLLWVFKLLIVFAVGLISTAAGIYIRNIFARCMNMVFSK